MALIVDNITSEGNLSGLSLSMGEAFIDFLTATTLSSLTLSVTDLVVTNATGVSTTDYYVTGGTYSGETLTLFRNGLSDVIVTGFTSGGGGGSGTLTGTGVADRVAFWNGASGLTYDDNFSWDSINQRLGVGLPNPSERLHVSGNTIIQGNIVITGGTSVNWISGNTSTDMLRITQGGSGNAFVVEDSTNPDASPFVITSIGSVGIGTTTPLTPLHVAGSGGTVDSGLFSPTIGADILTVSAENTAPGFNIVAAGNSAFHRGVFKATRSRGTLDTPTIPQDGDSTISLLGAIYDGVTNWPTAGITLEVDGSVSTNVAPQRMVFLTGTGSTRVERLRISSDGSVGIGTALPIEKLHVSGNTIVSGIISGSSLTITSTPTNNDTNQQILTRNPTSGNVEYSSPGSTAFYPYGIGFAQSISNYLT